MCVVVVGRCYEAFTLKQLSACCNDLVKLCLLLSETLKVLPLVGVLTGICSSSDRTYDDFVARLKEAERKRQCRYGIFDVRFIQNDVPQEKLAFFLWYVILNVDGMCLGYII